MSNLFTLRGMCPRGFLSKHDAYFVITMHYGLNPDPLGNIIMHTIYYLCFLFFFMPRDEESGVY